MGIHREGVCEGQSEEQDLKEARAEIVLMSTALKDPATGVCAVCDVRVGLPNVIWWDRTGQGREQEMTFFFVLRVLGYNQFQ